MNLCHFAAETQLKNVAMFNNWASLVGHTSGLGQVKRLDPVPSVIQEDGGHKPRSFHERAAVGG